MEHGAGDAKHNPTARQDESQGRHTLNSLAYTLKQESVSKDDPPRTGQDKREARMIELDGSIGEGGGQILRSALVLSMRTSQSLPIVRIRANRAKPGLMRQHLVAVHAAARISNATVTHAELGSTQLSFVPGAIVAGDYVSSRICGSLRGRDPCQCRSA